MAENPARVDQPSDTETSSDRSMKGSSSGGLVVAQLPLNMCGSVMVGLAVGAVTGPAQGFVTSVVVLGVAVWRSAQCSWRIHDRVLTIRGYLRKRTVHLRWGVRISAVTPWWAKSGTYVLVVRDDNEQIKIPSTYHFSRNARERELRDLKGQTRLRVEDAAGYTS